MLGGYQIIDLSAYTLSSTATTIAGIYDLITKAGKPLLITGAHKSDLTFSPVFSNYIFYNSKVIVPLFCMITEEGCAQWYLEITDENAVKLIQGDYAYTPEA